MMRYGTVCSGIEAPTMAWHGLGWTPQWFSEIEKFPKAVLAHHYPDVPDLGDMTKVDWNDTDEIDLLIGGTPCQSFSVAGLRKGLADPRGNLALEFLRIVDTKRPTWFIWENVPGILSSGGGRDFGSFLGAVAKLGYGCAYRVLDAQNFGVPQRRRRVFVVGHSGGWAGPAAVLFERESLSRDSAAGRKARQKTAGTIAPSITSSGPPYSRTGNSRVEADAMVVCMASGQANAPVATQRSPALDCNRDGAPIVFHPRQDPISGEVAQPSETSGPMAIYTGAAVRRLTSIECERLQGFPDNFTRIPWRGKQASDCPDGHRYKALGNSMAVPVVKWIGERINQVQGVAE